MPELLQLAYNNPTRSAITALIAVTAIGIALQAWRFTATMATPPVMVKSLVQSTTPTAVVSKIATAGLFGRAGHGSTAVNPPESTLGWVLRGAFTAATANTGSAIIETEPGQSHLIHAGQHLPANSRLLAVYNDRVVIEHNGHRETLRFPIPTAVATDQARAVLKATTGTNTTITPERRKEIRKRLEQLRQHARGVSSETSH